MKNPLFVLLTAIVCSLVRLLRMTPIVMEVQMRELFISKYTWMLIGMSERQIMRGFSTAALHSDYQNKIVAIVHRGLSHRRDFIWFV